MNKKAALFTIITFLMLFSLFVLTGSYTHKNRNMNILFTEINTNSQIKYYEDDIVSDVFSDICKFNINSISRQANNLTLGFSISEYQTGTDFSSEYFDYVDYVQSYYSQKNNINVSLQNFTPDFEIKPYGTNFLLNGSIQVLNNISHLKRISITIIINEDADNHTNSSPVDTGNTELEVDIYDASGKQLFSDTHANLDPSLVNEDFTIRLESGDEIKVEFGDIVQPGILQISTDTSVNITQLNLIHNITEEKIRITAGQIRIQSLAADLGKQGEILIGGEY